MQDFSAHEITSILEGFIESPYMYYVIVDENAYITAMNQTYLNLLELQKEDVIGRHILDITPDSQLPEVLKTGRVHKADVWTIKGQDTIVSRVPIIKNGKIIGAIANSLFLDMSGAKAFIRTLQETEKEYTAILEGLIESPYMAYVIVDREGYITFMNQTYLDILELSKLEVIGKHVLEITPTSKLPEVLQTGRMNKADIWPINGRNTIVSRVPIRKNGEIIGAIGQSLFLDMSAAKILIGKLEDTEKELNLYRSEIHNIYSANWIFDDLIGNNTEFARVKAMAKQLSHTKSTLLITGESGTGKELFAHSIHNASSRSPGPFVRINCAALPENLLESELYGYEEGAFTGARKGGKPGKFELARGGTIFLDEIGDMPLSMQTKLLSVLQEKVIERVGGTAPIPVDVRVIAATNQDLEKMVLEHDFREDLYYRLNVVRLTIPPLRNRLEDIPEMADNLLAKISRNMNVDITAITPDAVQAMQAYSWPGNVRELENLLERAVNLAIMTNDTILDIKHFPSLGDRRYSKIEILDNGQSSLPELLEGIEKNMLQQALKETGGNKTQTAKMLGIHSSALYRKLSKYSLD